MILNENEAHFNLLRSKFDVPFSSILYGHYIYKGSRLCDLFSYNEKEDGYYYEDELIMMWSSFKPKEINTISFDIKPISFGEFKNVNFFVSSSIDKIKTPLDSFICFKMIGSRKMRYSGYLITPDHYKKILIPSENTLNFNGILQVDIYKDLVVEEITERSLNKIFKFLEEKYIEDSSWLNRTFGEVRIAHKSIISKYSK